MDEIKWRDSVTGAIEYCVVEEYMLGTYWNGISLEIYNISHWVNYALGLTENPPGGYEYKATFPNTLAVGYYLVSIYRQLGISPLITDTLLGRIPVYWDGSNLLYTGIQIPFVDLRSG